MTRRLTLHRQLRLLAAQAFAFSAGAVTGVAVELAIIKRGLSFTDPYVRIWGSCVGGGHFARADARRRLVGSYVIEGMGLVMGAALLFQLLLQHRAASAVSSHTSRPGLGTMVKSQNRTMTESRHNASMGSPVFVLSTTVASTDAKDVAPKVAKTPPTPEQIDDWQRTLHHSFRRAETQTSSVTIQAEPPLRPTYSSGEDEMPASV